MGNVDQVAALLIALSCPFRLPDQNGKIWQKVFHKYWKHSLPCFTD